MNDLCHGRLCCSVMIGQIRVFGEVENDCTQRSQRSGAGRVVRMDGEGETEQPD